MKYCFHFAPIFMSYLLTIEVFRYGIFYIHKSVKCTRQIQYTVISYKYGNRIIHRKGEYCERINRYKQTIRR